MLTKPSTDATSPTVAFGARAHVTQKVMIVNGTTEILGGLEALLEAGHYDVVFVESSQHAYSQIKRVQPNLVILCAGIDDTAGLQVLSMLKLDDATRAMPVLTYTTEFDGASERAVMEPADTDALLTAMTTAARMN